MPFRPLLIAVPIAAALAALPPMAARADDGPLGEHPAPALLQEYEIQASIEALAASMNRKMSQLQTLLLSAEAVLAQTDDEKAVHTALNRMIEGLPFLRAIIVIDAQGALWCDSISYPAARMNLSGRAYFRRFAQAPLHRLSVGAPVVGRSSGLPFIPLGMRLRTPRGDRIAVAVAIPDALVDQPFRCPSCSTAIVGADGGLLASSPGGYSPPPELVKKVLSSDGSHPIIADISLMTSRIDWRRIPNGEFHVIFSKYAQ